MGMSVSQNKTYRPIEPSQWGYYFGHGGITYGFSSNQGYILPASAGFSITSNTDSPMFSGLATCKAIEIAAEVIGGHPIFLNCSNHQGPFMEVDGLSAKFRSRFGADLLSSAFGDSS